ncbi:MAG: hypothetical protein L6Q29_03350 [Candidatus Pacebacteria bacterium]|nr:hypothetical protein [Candidatus Paceibacterota bacterium]
MIDTVWEKSEYFDEDELNNYRKTWRKMQPKRNSLTGAYGNSKATKPIFKAKITNLTWEEFVKEVQNDKIHSLHGRLKVIEKANDYFGQYKHFEDMPINVRKVIAASYYGSVSILKDNIEWKWFGSMWGAGNFKNLIIENNKNISKALDQIPRYGNIAKAHFEYFKKYFVKAYQAVNPLGTATRLLAMKRPDVFVCIDSKNKRQLCKDFGISQSKLDLDNYWDLIIERIFDSDWWQSPNPKNKLEERISNSRSAFLDSLFYVV